MKNAKKTETTKAVVILLLNILFVHQTNVFAQGQTIALNTNLTGAPLSTGLPPPPGFASRQDYLNSFTNKNDAVNAYHAGLLDKDEAAKAMMAAANKASVDIYAKVVDQNGQPVAGAKVEGHVDLGFGDTEEHDTITDVQGEFNFIGLHGQGLGIWLQKEGYEYDAKDPFQRAAIYVPDPNNPVTITMWKLRGPGSMAHKEFDSRVPYDGTSVSFNLATGKKDAAGDLKITLSRSPLRIRRGRDKYDWILKIETPTGGLFAENDAYPYWAPETGYKSSFEVNMSSNNIPWSAEWRQNFYIKNAQGKYGRLFIDLSTDSMRPDTGITVQTWINPSGSQNLEFDPKKQIR